MVVILTPEFWIPNSLSPLLRFKPNAEIGPFDLTFRQAQGPERSRRAQGREPAERLFGIFEMDSKDAFQYRPSYGPRLIGDGKAVFYFATRINVANL